ncbi:MAG TPA: glycosyl hydrolase family 8 [Polyangiaceae bacterium]|nr:glycosyl hydrolase family 8 [Polyangiaceae bacterium]
MPCRPLFLNFLFLLSISSVLGCSSSEATPANSASAGSTPSDAAGAGGTGGTPVADTGGTGDTGGIAGTDTAGSTGGTDTLADCVAGGAAPAAATPRAECSAPAGYRNLFADVLCKPTSEVQAKLTGIVQQLFHGSGQDQAIYYELSANSSQAYIEDIASGDVRSEGQSYGMFIAVQMNMRTEFDKLWNYAKACMQQPSGVFAWQMNVDSCTPKSTGQAPDGDEYFAEALRLADRRWGSSGAIDYRSEALKIMAAVAAHDFNSNPAIVKFSQNSNFSDPSYVLPLFYTEWACFDTANASLWRSAASYARSYFPKVFNASTGLAPYQSNFDGSAYAAGNTFNADAWRVPMNIMSDFALNRAGSWQTGYATTNAAFWTSQGLDTYGGKYSLTGEAMDQYHGAGLTGVNAMLAFGLSPAQATPFLQAAWDQGAPTGQYRYYDGTLYMLSMLYLTGTINLFY